MSNTNKHKKYEELIKACIKYGADSRDGKITKTKLAKLIYLADFIYYYENLKSITDLKYKKLPRGPVTLEYFDAVDSLVAEKEINLDKRGKAIMISLNDDFSNTALNTDELKLVKKICKKWQDKKTSEIVDFSHEQLPWKISFEGETIPYSLIIQQDEKKLY